MATYTSNYGWTKPSGSDNVDISVLNDNLDDQDSTIHDAFLNMAPPFSESSTYAVDDIVLYGTGLYKCHTAVVTPGSWTGSTNWQVYKLSEGGGGGLTLGETSSTAYRGDRGKTAYDHSQATGNPHGTTKSDVGLGNVPNVTTNDQEPTFTEASTRNNIASGEKLSVIMGKVQKFFNDLKTVAFTGSFSDLSNKPSINSVELSGNKTTSDLGLQDELTFDNVPTDGSNNPVKSDGIYDSEKDIYAVMGKMGAKNLLPYPYSETTKTLHGVTFTDNGDGSVTVSTVAGGASAAVQLVMQTRLSDKIHLKAGNYKLSGCPSGGSATTYILQASNTSLSPQISVIDTGSGADIQMAQDASLGVWINIAKNAVITTPITFKPMLRLASDTDDTYQPYAKTNRELTESYPANKVIMSDGVTSVEDRLDSNTISSESAVSLAYNTEYTTLSDGYFKITCNAGLDTWATGKVNNIAVIQCTSVPTQTANGMASIFVHKGSKIKFSGKNSTDAGGSFYPLQ